jgi:hypothetical protein
MEYLFSFLFFFVFCIVTLRESCCAYWALLFNGQPLARKKIQNTKKKRNFFFLATMDEHGDMSIQEGVDLRVAAGVKRGAYYHRAHPWLPKKKRKVIFQV